MCIYIVLNNSPFYGGGVESVVKNIVDNFDNGDVVLICNDKNKPELFHYKNIRCINLKTKSYKYFDKLILFSQLIYSYRIFKFIKSNISYKDIVNVHGIEYSFFLSLLRPLIGNNFSLIISAHGSYFRQYTMYVVKRLPAKFFIIKLFFYLWRWYFYVMEWIILRNVDFLIFTTKKMESFFINTYKIKHLRMVISLGVDVSMYKNNPNNKNNKSKSAIIIGSNTYLKGLDVAIGAMSLVNEDGVDIKLIILGFDDFFDYYKKEEVPHFVNYVGRVSPGEVNNWFEISDFLLLPTRYESFGLVPLESILNKRPIIVSSAGANAEINYTNYGIVVSGYDIYDWRDAILKMTNKKVYSNFASNINNVNVNHLDWKNIIKEYEKVFRKFQ